VKQQLPHGQFGAWLQAEFGMTERTARNYMNAAVEFGAKSEIISDLPATTLYALSAPSTPAPVKEVVIARLESGERLNGQEVQDLIRDARDTERQAREEAKLMPRQRRTRAQQQAERERHRQEREREQQEREVATHALVEFLEAKLGADLPAFLALAQRADLWRALRILRNRPPDE
jgi:hypothetical protein